MPDLDYQPPFAAHAALMGQYQNFIAGGKSRSGLATLTFSTMPQSPVLPVTHTEIMADFEFMPGGKSATTFVERCEFLVSDMNGNVPEKGIRVTLTVKSGLAYEMQLWHGGPVPGGEIYRFMLVDRNYKA